MSANARILYLPGILVRCTKCKVEQERSAFGVNLRKANGLASWCKACNAKAELARGRRRDPGRGTRSKQTDPKSERVVCARCYVAQDRAAFQANKRMRSGVTSWCKACTRERAEELRQQDPERANRYRLQYHQRLRMRVLEKFGSRCNNPLCAVPGGCTDVRCLHVDHVRNDGYLEKRYGGPAGGRSRVSILQRALKDTTGRFQLLCANCNWIKEVERRQALALSEEL